MFALVVLLIRHQNELGALEYSYAKSLQTYGIIMFLINNFLFICLILYKFRKKSGENDQNFHEPIFNQLFYNSAFWLVATDLCLLINFLGEISSDENFQSKITALCFAIEYFLKDLGSIMFAIIGMFSFLAAIQRITIFYLPKYKFLVTGVLLKYEICLVYASVIHYSYTTYFSPMNTDNYETKNVCYSHTESMIFSEPPTPPQPTTTRSAR
ncbi:hypothetical protein CRE_15911 [Caenorhabditis remanei]|uniref:Uncharacterized protein n=1 Tax=Caenorhabditis remanei TaxID=31234 RepID=E3MBH3_CAERE|nr:hypothetical protein CRE_15911 [Caenorhabditis remanei]